MFEQHPVPQNISSYQFRLVGDMTLKQFFELAAGAIIALLFYSAPLPSFLRWPLIIISIIGGAAFAFLPLQDRPLEQWFAAFFRSIYNPTIYYWSQPTTPTNYFKDELTSQTQPTSPGQPVTPPPAPNEDKQEEPHESKLDKQEEDLLAKIDDVLEGKNVSYDDSDSKVTEETINETPAPTPNFQDRPTQQPEGRFVTGEKPETQQKEVEPKAPLTTPAQKVIEISEHKGFTEEKVPQAKEDAEQNLQNPVVSEAQVSDAQQAQFSPQAAPPVPPEQPNTIVGQVMDNEGKVVDAAILEIKDSLGRPVRALRSNQVGHFRIVTPLLDGEYTITTEKEGLIFDSIKFVANGETIEPIAIKAN